ncbi:MAG: HEAT repeat domain-containing protein, partial [Candidatus Hodarchaeales archaeon]
GEEMSGNNEVSTPIIRASLSYDIIHALSKTLLVVLCLYLSGLFNDMLITLILYIVAVYLLFSVMNQWSSIITYFNASRKTGLPYMRQKPCPFLKVSFLELDCKVKLEEPYILEDMEKCHVTERWKECWETKAPPLLEILFNEESSIQQQAMAVSYLSIMGKEEALPKVIELLENLDEAETQFRRILLSSLSHLLACATDEELILKGAGLLLSNQGSHGRLVDMTITEGLMFAGKALIQPFKEFLAIPLYIDGSEVVLKNEQVSAYLDVTIGKKVMMLKFLTGFAPNYPSEVLSALSDLNDLESDLARAFRVKALAATGLSECIPLLIQALSDEDDLVVAEARKGLRKFGNESLDRLLDVLFDESTNDDTFDDVAGALETFDYEIVSNYLSTLKEKDIEKHDDIIELARNNNISIFLQETI